MIRLRRLLCRHSHYTVSETVNGVCLGWDLSPHVSHTYHRKCRDCGKSTTRRGYIPNDPMTRRDADGWPLTQDGKRMAIAK